MNSTPAKLSRTVGACEARARLLELLDMVECGREITITRHFRPIARLVPMEAPPVDHRVFRRIRALRSRLALAPGETARDLINAGRRI